MPKFTTISPTCERGGKPASWERFRNGKYIAIGWCYKTDLTGKTIEEVLSLVPDDHCSNERDLQDARRSFPTFWKLEPGDYVGVRNTNDGLFGIGVIRSAYKYDRFKHFTGIEDHYYPHYFDVDWVWTEYIRRNTLDFSNEQSWAPFGTLSEPYPELPAYILPFVSTAIRKPTTRKLTATHQ